MERSCRVQRQSICKRRTLPIADSGNERTGFRIVQKRAQRGDHPRGYGRAIGNAIVHLIGIGLPNRTAEPITPCIHGVLHIAFRRCPFPAARLNARPMPNPLTFAVPKGRILDEALPLMARAGVVPDAEFHDKKSRALSFACAPSDIWGDMRLIRVRAFDVATFVAHGAAQVGIVGSDVVEEFAYPDLYAPVDLDIGHCRLSVAEPVGEHGGALPSHLRIASKYPNLTRRHFEKLGVQAEVVKLNGAMELAPTLGLSSRIVDLVSTGRTLKENGLVETSRILDISARLIVNRAALKTDERVAALIERFRAIVAESKAAA